MAILAGIPILVSALILQTSIASRVTLLNGRADLILLVLVPWIMHERVKTSLEWALIAGVVVGFVSEVPFWLLILGYLLIAGIGNFMKSRVWQVPLMALFAVIFVGTLILHLISLSLLLVSGIEINLAEAFNNVTLPSLLLNLLLAIPINAIIVGIADWFYPEEPET